MKTIAVLIFLFLSWSSCFSQGGWDIGYIAIDSVDQDEIGKDIKLDFRNEYDTNTTVHRFLMRFIAQEDSVTIMLDGKKIELIESRNIHVDWGFYDE